MKQGMILPNRIVVTEIPRKEKVLAGGIIAPMQVQKNETLSGKVVLTGSACDTIEEGMTVLYPRLAATKFNVEDDLTDYFLLPESNVLFAFWGE